jgi:hypothetical protein
MVFVRTVKSNSQAAQPQNPGSRVAHTPRAALFPTEDSAPWPQFKQGRKFQFSSSDTLLYQSDSIS